MTPLSNILTERSETLSFTETLERVEQEAHDTIAQAEQISSSVPASAESTPAIELSQIKQALLDMRQQIDMMVSALEDNAQTTNEKKLVTTSPPVPRFVHTQTPAAAQQAVTPIVQQRKLSKPIFANGSQIIEGRFDGKYMITESKATYEVPANYASKSKMVEGDVLKLTITQDGRQFYKQIGPVKRKSLMGELSQDPQGNWVVIADMIPYRILTASVTFHRARQGDKVVILVPEDAQARWGAVDTFLK